MRLSATLAARGHFDVRSQILLLILLAFTVFAVAGYATFGLHPHWLAHVPHLAPFYAISFTLFGQAHVWLAALVLFIYLIRRAGARWLAAFAALYLTSLASELVGTTYGVPFGSYSYTGLLGVKWFDRVPVIIPLSWFLMAVPSLRLAWDRFPGSTQWPGRIALATLLLATWDLSLDPAMSSLTPYWVWGEPGSYYGMPWLNLVGWITTGAVLMILLTLLRADRWLPRLSRRWVWAYYLITLCMPLGMLLAAGLWGAAFATCAALATALFVMRTGPARLEEADSLDLVQRAAMRAFFQQHSRSFSFAARWFPDEERHLIACLYRFCRTLDDTADVREASIDEAERRLDLWLARSRQVYDGGKTGIPWFDLLMSRSAQAGLPFRYIEELVAGIRSDLGPVVIRSGEELRLYTYRVASVVGIWMCYLFGVRDEETLHRAAALGHAMQTTNILRDVGEDLAHGRVYLPADRMLRYGLTVADLERFAERGDITPAYRDLIEELMAYAEKDYAYAFPGLRDVPPSFARASAVAAEVYRGIHAAIRRNGYDNLRKRACTRSFEKGLLAIRGLYRLVALRRSEARAAQTAMGMASSSRISRMVQRMLPGIFALPIYCHGSPVMAAPVCMTAHAVDTTWHGELTVAELRDAYLCAVENEVELDRTLDALQTESRYDPLTQAYGAALVVLKAKHAFWPHRKMHFLREGLPVLDRLVEQHPRHVEIRYLRLLSCYYLPGFLRRKKSVQEDFAALARLLPSARSSFEPGLYRQMVRFVLEKGAIAEGDRARLQRLWESEDERSPVHEPGLAHP